MAERKHATTLGMESIVYKQGKSEYYSTGSYNLVPGRGELFYCAHGHGQPVAVTHDGKLVTLLRNMHAHAQAYPRMPEQ